MEDKTDEEVEGLPDVYLSPSRSIRNCESAQFSSETDSGALDETDTEHWIPLPAEITNTQNLTIATEPNTTYLGQREEIEGGSSQESQSTSLVIGDRPEVNLGGSTGTCIGTLNERGNVAESHDLKTQSAVKKGSSKLTGKRGETPGSDCPHTANLGAFATAVRRPLVLDTQTGVTDSTELVFSPGGDQGFMVVPSPLTNFDDSCSDTEALEWMSAYGAVGGIPALVPVRDAVEGADSAVIPAQNYPGVRRGVTGLGMQDLQRNSPAGLSTPDGDLDITIASSSSEISKKMEAATVRPPVVGQSEELDVVERKDLGSTDGEESSDDGQIRPTIRAPGLFCPTEAQPGSLGSQSENTDSVKTVVDFSRGETQGCETDHIVDTGVQQNTAQMSLKPSFVVGGPISPRGKFRQFQNTVRDRMQDMKASLETQEEAPELDRERYLAQPPLYPPVTLESEQEVSLASMVSVDSTNHPESSERVTSPSVLSVSSAASSKKMEWDSGADVGYTGGATVGTPEETLTSLSTLERIAIGSYASVLRTEPEGTTQVRERQRISKRGGRVGTGRLGQSGGSKQYHIMEGTISSTHSSPSHRAQQVCVSSSEEDLSRTTASPSQSPRRKPKRRSQVSGIHEGDSRKKTTRVHSGLDRRLRELRQEHSGERSSSLVELGKVGMNCAKQRRSNSQYSLSLPHHLLDNFSTESSVGRSLAGTINTSTSTSTLIPSVSPRPASASTSSTQVADPQPPSHSPPSGNSKHGSLSSIAISESRHTNIHTSSSNNHSPRSQESSDFETWGGRETDNDSLTSHSFPRRHSHSLKAKKNTENARNHESMAKQNEQTEMWKSKEHHQTDSSLSSIAQSSAVTNQIRVQGSLEESARAGVSPYDSNVALQSLSVRLLARIQALGEAGCLGQGRDYHKLRDYATFIGIPASTEEERRLRQGVANVIMRMFGEIGGFDQTSESSHASDTLASDTFPSATSCTLPSDIAPTGPSDISDSHSGKQWPVLGCSDGILSTNQSQEIHEELEIKNSEEVQEKERFPPTKSDVSEENRAPREVNFPSRIVSGEERCITPGGTVVVVPYRPPSATRTYYMAVSQEHEGGLVEGERAQDTCPASSPIPSLSSPVPKREAIVSRGQAEGWREEGNSAPAPRVSSRPIPTQLEDNEKWVGFGREAWGEDHGEILVPHEWGQQRPPIHSPTTSDDLSPTLDHPSWHMLRPTYWKERDDEGEKEERREEEDEEEEKREKAAAEWWAGQGGTGRLYQDRMGTLHLAQQPPGYQEDRDSHASESPSDQDPRRPAPSRLPWTSSGSESAYETIRERHRRVDEALASSFEFYSTSPRPARLMSCTPPSGQNDDDEDDEEEEDENSGQQDCPPPHIPSPHGIHSPQESDQLLTSKSRSYSLNPSSFIDSHHTSPSSHTEGNDVSSQISLIQLQKQRHVRKIQRHILTLEKLERALLDQLGDSLGSEGSFCRRVTEGCSHTESNNNGKTRQAILGQSGTGTSSLASSDYSERTLQGQRQASKPVGQPTGSNTGESNEFKITSNKATGESYTSSPRATTSMISSDLTNSRASTMGQMEEEVQRLASTEAKSRHFLQKAKDVKHKSKDGKQKSLSSEIKILKREEPRGEEGPGHQPRTFQVSEVLSPQKSSSEVSSLAKQKSGSSGRSNNLGLAGMPSSSKKAHTAWTLSEDEEGVSDTHILRKGDGREVRDKRGPGKKNDRGAVSLSLQKKVTLTTSSSSSSIQGSPSMDQNRNDFGQMFPSTGNIHSYGSSEVGIQTGDSLLYASKKKRSVGTVCSGSSSSSPAYSTTTVATSTTSHRGRIVEQQKDQSSKPSITREKNKTICSKRQTYAAPTVIEQLSDDSNRNVNRISKMKSNREKMKSVEKQTFGAQRYKDEKKKKRTGKSEHTETSSEVSQASYYKKSVVSRNRNTKKESLGVRGKSGIDCSKENTHISDCMRQPLETRRKRVQSNQITKDLAGRKGLEKKKINKKIYGRKNETEVETEDRPESTSRSEYSTQDQYKSLSSRYSVSSESTSTGEVGEAEIEDEEENGSRQEHAETQFGEDQSTSHLPHPAYQGTQREHTVGVHNERVKRPDHPIFIVPPPPGQKLKKNEGRIYNYAKDDSEKKTHGLLTTSDLSEDSFAKRRHISQMVYTDGSQVRFTSITSSQASDSLIALNRRTVAGQTDMGTDVIKLKKPVRFEVPLENKENFHPHHTTITVNMGQLQKKTSKDNLSLQEALARAKPKYIRKAGDRRAVIQLKKEMRQSNQSRNHELVAQIPSNLQTPSTLQRFLYKSDLSPLFTYRDIREQNRRLYNLLPESGCPVVRQRRCAEKHTNRLMAQLYSQRLRKKVMKGQVSHAHKEIVTPISTRNRSYQLPPPGY